MFTLKGSQLYTKLDLIQAYYTLPLHTDCVKYFTITSNLGSYSYQYLPMGFVSSPFIFQSFMDTLLEGIPNVHAYMDDVLIHSETVEEHLILLERVLKRLQYFNISINLSKC